MTTPSPSPIDPPSPSDPGPGPIDPPRRRGRPPGVRLDRETHFRMGAEDKRRLDELRGRWGCSEAAAIRRALELAAGTAGVE